MKNNVCNICFSLRKYTSTYILVYFTGFVLRLPVCDSPKGDGFFSDSDFWEIPEEGRPNSGDNKADNKNRITTAVSRNEDTGQ